MANDAKPLTDDEFNRFKRQINSELLKRFIATIDALKAENSRLRHDLVGYDELRGEVQGLEYTVGRIYAKQIEECSCGGGNCDACRLMAEDCRRGREVFDTLKAENVELADLLRRIRYFTDVATNDLIVPQLKYDFDEFERCRTSLQSDLAAANERLSKAVRALQGVADLVPATWLDPLLSGPTSKVINARNGAQIEAQALLRAVRARIAAATCDAIAQLEAPRSGAAEEER